MAHLTLRALIETKNTIESFGRQDNLVFLTQSNLYPTKELVLISILIIGMVHATPKSKIVEYP
nr:hypothetical protein BCU73_09860 [Vibrio cyclitrophicus]